MEPNWPNDLEGESPMDFETEVPEFSIMEMMQDELNSVPPWRWEPPIDSMYGLSDRPPAYDLPPRTPPIYPGHPLLSDRPPAYDLPPRTPPIYPGHPRLSDRPPAYDLPPRTPPIYPGHPRLSPHRTPPYNNRGPVHSHTQGYRHHR